MNRYARMKAARRSLAATAVGIGAAALTFGFGVEVAHAASIAFPGRDFPQQITAMPGAEIGVPFTYQNNGPTVTFQPNSGQIVFTAPANTTFPPQSTVPNGYSTDTVNYSANNLAAVGCVLTNGNDTLTCQLQGINGGNTDWSTSAYFRYTPEIIVSPTAPRGQTLTPIGNATMTFIDTTGTAYSINNGTLNVATAPIFTGVDAPETVTIAPGSSDAVPFTYENTGANVTFPATGGTITFNAPANTTFASQSTVPASYSSDGTTFGGNNAGAESCTLSNGNATLTCALVGSNGGNTLWPSGTWVRYSPQLVMSPTAPAAQTTVGQVQLSWTDPTDQAPYRVSNGTLNVATPPVAGGPIANPMIAGIVIGGLAALVGGVAWTRRRHAGASV